MDEATAGATVVVGYEGRPQSRDALALARLLGSGWNASVLALWVPESDEPYSSTEPARRRVRIDAGRALRVSAGELMTGGQEWDFSIQPASAPARGLHDVAAEQGASAIVVGSSHLGPLGRVLVGSTAARLLIHAPCPVAVAPRGWADPSRPGPARVGVGLDGCPDCEVALSEAQALADGLGAGLVKVTVADPKHAADELAEASQDLDLLVVGCRACSGVVGHPLRSVSRRLIRTSACPLIVVPQRVPAGAGRPDLP
jgi:nucleotide-binding universal stress UspA family protein